MAASVGLADRLVRYEPRRVPLTLYVYVLVPVGEDEDKRAEIVGRLVAELALAQLGYGLDRGEHDALGHPQ